MDYIVDLTWKFTIFKKTLINLNIIIIKNGDASNIINNVGRKNVINYV